MQGQIFIFLMGGVRKSLGGVRKSLGGGVQLFALAWDVGLVGADRSKLERKKLCIILCPVYLRIVLNKLLNKLKFWSLIVSLGGGVEKNFGGVQNHSGGLINILGGAHPPHPPRKSVPDVMKELGRY